MTPAECRRLVMLLGMLGSAHDGERANAASIADQLVRGLGLTWNDIVGPPSRREVSNRAAISRELDFADVQLCLDHAQVFSAKQVDFLHGLAGWVLTRGALTRRQRAVLDDMLERVESPEGRAA